MWIKVMKFWKDIVASVLKDIVLIAGKCFMCTICTKDYRQKSDLESSDDEPKSWHPCEIIVHLSVQLIGKRPNVWLSSVGLNKSN